MPQRIAIGRILAVLALGAIIVAGTAGLLVATGSHPAVTSTSASPSTATFHVFSNSTSSHSATLTVTLSSSTGSSRSLIGPPPTVNFLFGAQDVGNTTVTIPADTLVWTSWKLNSTEQIGGVEAALVVPASGVNSTIACAIYIDGKLAGNETYPIGPVYGLGGGAISQAQEAAVFAGIPSNETQPAGTVISMAILAPTTILPKFDGGGGVQTEEATLSAGVWPPVQLPSPTSTIPSTMEIWAYNET